MARDFTRSCLLVIDPTRSLWPSSPRTVHVRDGRLFRSERYIGAKCEYSTASFGLSHEHNSEDGFTGRYSDGYCRSRRHGWTSLSLCPGDTESSGKRDCRCVADWRVHPCAGSCAIFVTHTLTCCGGHNTPRRSVGGAVPGRACAGTSTAGLDTSATLHRRCFARTAHTPDLAACRRRGPAT